MLAFIRSGFKRSKYADELIQSRFKIFDYFLDEDIWIYLYPLDKDFRMFLV
ncbi:MAG: hypothetical protein WC364_10115 [Eubacteriales bacterium]